MHSIGLAVTWLLAACASGAPHVDAGEVVLPPASAAPHTSAAPEDLGSGTGAAPVTDRVQVTIPTGGIGQALGLSIEVLENVEKRTMDGGTLMRVSLRVIDGYATEDVFFESPGSEEATWGRYRFTYRGGWRTEVIVDVERLPPGP